MIKDIEGDTTQVDMLRLKELFTELKELFEIEENLRLIEDPLDTFQHYIEEVISFSMEVSYEEFKREIITFSDNLKSLYTHIKERTNNGYIIRVYPLYHLTNVLHEYERLIIQSKELGLNLPPLSDKLIKRLVPVM